VRNAFDGGLSSPSIGIDAPLLGLLRLFLKKTRGKKARSLLKDSWPSDLQAQRPTLAAVLSAGVADYGVNSPSISNGWPGPQPLMNSRIAAAQISKIVVLTTFLPVNIGHFLLEDTVSP
jgi:hypothetical protein